MKVAVLGYGSQGISSVEYWQGLGHEVTVCDRSEDVLLPESVKCRLGKTYLKGLDKFDLLVRAPSIHPDKIVKANPDFPEILNKVTSNTSEFLDVCPTKNVIGVTGTKGKGTTSTLITGMLEEAGYRVHLGGNIGTPPLEMLKSNIKPDDWVVLELANFQLIDIKSSTPYAVCVMVEAEHQDWHSSVEEYIRVKQQLFRWQKEEDVAVYYGNSALSTQVVSVTRAKKIPYFKEPGAVIHHDKVMIDDTVICSVSHIRLIGKHNWQNVCAAVTLVWQITKDQAAIRNAIKYTVGLPFRLQFIRDLEGVSYYNDSFGTTPGTAIVAIQAFAQPKVIILGGSDKGSPYTELAKTVAGGNVKSVIAVGDTGPAISEALRAEGFNNITEGGNSMEKIVALARKQAEEDDIVLLSTGCASFGMFENYKDRGEQFTRAVESLS